MTRPIDLLSILLIGAAATAVLDAWLLLLARLGLPAGNFGLIGRWVGHMRSGRFVHAAIGKAAPVRGELALGWLTHYAVGVAYAGALVLLLETGWTRQPTLPPALLFGVATAAVPLFVMQPAMGSGLAASRTPAPLRNVLRTIANHSVFGMGLYLAARLLERIVR